MVQLSALLVASAVLVVKEAPSASLATDIFEMADVEVMDAESSDAE